ncbi:MAG: HAMP domain-containing protein [Phycisphaeraceae bacterium]|nr:HAMP domain-containing protein [Phycisphaeraceae bacterium]
MRRPIRISLANKCQILFGAAVLLIILAALAVAWVRMSQLVEAQLAESARSVAQSLLSGQLEVGRLSLFDPFDSPERDEMLVRLIRSDEFVDYTRTDSFIAQAIERFERHPDATEAFADARHQGARVFRYARAVRKSETGLIGGPFDRFGPDLSVTHLADPLSFVLLVQLRTDTADRQLLINRIYIIAGGLLAGLLAIAAFWFITTRLILSPVRLLRDTAEKVGEGDLNIRSDIDTGDEFEQLSDVFNTMLENLRKNQEELRSANKSLDLRLGALAEINVALDEANKVKGEFLANVSHELRTPLNAIIGFAEVLEQNSSDQDDPEAAKRRRYLNNIVASGRHLLELIKDLLDLAKIEAGRMDIRPAPTSIADTCEGLINLMRPQAEKRGVELELDIQRNLPLVVTDAGRLQQILFNFLSNAIKFTPEGGTVTLSAMLWPVGVDASRARLRLSVRDTGPGIAPENHQRIFDKFKQLDHTVTREHGGTGLGLTISRDLAKLLQGEILLDSNLGEGATFSLIIPLEYSDKPTPLMPRTAARP